MAQRKLLDLLRDLDARAVAEVLEPFATPERIARFRGVFAARLDAITVLMDACYDPQNGAAVVRTCDAFGLQRMHIVERSETFLASTNVARGSERWVDVHTYRTTAEALAALRATGHELIATHPNGELQPADLRHIPRFALILGNERDGIHPELNAAATRSVAIPMRGFAESLNVSVAAAILLQHATSTREGDLPEAEKAYLYARALILTIPHAPEILAARGISLPAPLPMAATGRQGAGRVRSP
ncbi:Hypothetical protein CAP_8405 [Chondromyces apiculatus DSM 436]|uniref:tRNA/rRNA methyltransferase SpoU type domain-containing protein n=1 Tax=Chondromyces apiculatus DSM 436 TaxID=1192034 RepID=A0A017SWK8_9BACT|nr:Hypothetical protein CAP_8405 [Chondromyces apiculatus DSM 436]